MTKFLNIWTARNKMYLLLSTLLSGFVLLLNASNKLAICSFIYVVISLIANIISEVYGQKRAIYAILISSILSILALWNTDYYINNIKFDIMLIGSFTSVIISVYLGTSLFLKLRPACNFQVRNLIGLTASSIVDCSIMAMVLSSKFSANKVAFIFSKDIVFKFSYSLILGLCLVLGFYLIKQFQKSEKDFIA